MAKILSSMRATLIVPALAIVLAARSSAAEVASLKSRELPSITNVGMIQGAALSPDGRTLYLVHSEQLGIQNDQDVVAFDTLTGKQQKPLAGCKSGSLLAVSPDGGLLAGVGTDPAKAADLRAMAGEIRVWELPAAKLRTSWDAQHDILIYGMAFSPDGASLATFGPPRDRYLRSNEVRIWDAATGKLKIRIDTRNQPADYSAWGGFGFLPDGKHVAASASGEVRFYDVTTGKQITAIRHGYEYLGGFEISPDGKRLLTWDFQRGTPAEAARVDRPVKPSRLDLWDIAKKTRVAALAGHASQITGGRFSPSGKTVIACDQGEGSPPSTATPAQLLRDRSAYILEWDLRTFRVVAGARGKVNMPDGGLGGDSDGSVAGKNKIHFSQDGSTLAYVKLNSVKLWSTNRGPKRPSSDTLAPPVDKPDADKPEEGDAPMGDGVELREWRLRDAKNAFEARFVAFSNGKVTLEKKDGAKLTLPIGRLSMEDQEYVRQRAPVEK